jgi:hypothetical protein
MLDREGRREERDQQSTSWLGHVRSVIVRCNRLESASLRVTSTPSYVASLAARAVITKYVRYARDPSRHSTTGSCVRTWPRSARALRPSAASCLQENLPPSRKGRAAFMLRPPAWAFNSSPARSDATESTGPAADFDESRGARGRG